MSAILFGLPASEYHCRSEVNKTLLDCIELAPAKALQYLNGARDEQTASMLLGTAVHAAVLEPATVVYRPKFDRRTKEGKEQAKAFDDAFNGSILSIIDYSLRGDVDGMLLSVFSHPKAKALLSGGHSEVTVISELDGIQVKCRPDYLRDDGIIVDLKTAQHASPRGFAKSVSKFRYHVQAAFYTDVCRSAGIEVLSFIFVAVETKPPYLVACYVLDPLDVERGREAYKRNLATYKDCLESGVWKGYSDDIQVLELSAWARSQQAIQGKW